MNELLLKLVKQSKIELSPAQFSGVLEAEVSEYQLEEFAKFIVKECMTICEDAAERNEPAIECYYFIKRQFGI